MSGDVVPLKIVDSETEPNPEVVAALEGLLAEAKAGNVRGLGYALVLADGSFQTFWTGGKNMNFALAAGIMRLAWRYQSEAFNEREGEHGKPA